MTARLLAIALFTSLLATPMFAQRDKPNRITAPGGIDPYDVESTWKFLQADPLHEKALTVYWMPASLKDAERAAVMKSSELAKATTRCVDLEIVLPEHMPAIAKLIPAGTAPAAIMIDRDSKVVRSAASPKEIEKMVHDELASRDDAMLHTMLEADRNVREGNSAAAIDLYRKIWNDRCLYTAAGAEAQRALKRLGVTVAEPTAPAQPFKPH